MLDLSMSLKMIVKSKTKGKPEALWVASALPRRSIKARAFSTLTSKG